jgi:DNA-binding LytR/AlgR family response regulator
VLYIEASNNYTNIHYINEDHEDCFILHNSMKNVEDTYASIGMLRCHRGYLVNLENIKLIRRDKDGMVIELAQSNKTIPVSKTYVNKVAHSFAGNISE